MSAERIHEVRIVRDARIPIPADGPSGPRQSLSADLYLPVTDDPVPALVSVTPYRKDALGGIGAAGSLRWFAAHGYACLLVDFRGTGSSDGRARPPFDPAEADDGVAAVEWAARQPWCTGAVGMWGLSYGAVLTLRTAARRPEHLGAIIPVLGMPDPERDFIHPSGAAGCFAPLGVWGLGTLCDQLLPPLHAHRSAAEQQRWRQRVEQAEPYLLDLYRHRPGHRVWRSRVVDAGAVTAPAFCVAGWRDMFCDGSLRAYEQLRGPRKLLVGPWMHTMPQESPFDPVDFHALALRWWDRWLAGTDNGVDREPAVTVRVMGHRPRWRSFDSWPPTGESVQVSAAGVAGPLTARIDPAVGSLGGLWGIPTSGFGLPCDQHEDDMGSLTVTGPPLERSLLLIGRPVAALESAQAGGFGRLVVKLTDVDPAGRSTLITGGVLADATTDHRVVLDPTAYHLPVGHRLRVVVSDGAFPRLWPSGSESAPEDRVLRLTRVDLALPVVAAAEGEPAVLPEPEPDSAESADSGDSGDSRDGAGLWIGNSPRWTISRDLIHRGTTVTMGGSLSARTPQREHLLDLATEITATVESAVPGAARVHAGSTATVRLDTGEHIVVRVELQLTEGAAVATGTVRIDGVEVVGRRWHTADESARREPVVPVPPRPSAAQVRSSLVPPGRVAD